MFYTDSSDMDLSGFEGIFIKTRRFQSNMMDAADPDIHFGSIVCATKHDFGCVNLLYSSSNHAESILRNKLGLHKVTGEGRIEFCITKKMKHKKIHISPS